MTNSNRIKVKAMCLFIRNGRILVTPVHDQTADKHFYRLPGGSVEFGETAEQAMQRESQEELGSGVSQLRFLEVVENIFTYQGNSGHEVVFIFAGELEQSKLYDQPIIHFTEGQEKYEARWIETSQILNGGVPLYPELDYQKYFSVHRPVQ